MKKFCYILIWPLFILFSELFTIFIIQNGFLWITLHFVVNPAIVIIITLVIIIKIFKSYNKSIFSYNHIWYIIGSITYLYFWVIRVDITLMLFDKFNIHFVN